jgi:monoamine oxidase
MIPAMEATPVTQGRWYDDGRADVPGGVDGEVGRVVVVGAGIAGLTVAAALRQAGIDHVVLEARDRVGGRLHTVDVAGTPVDLGGSWIHHPIGNPMSALAAELGVAVGPGDPLPTVGGYDHGEGRRLSRPEVEKLMTLVWDEYPAAAEDLIEECGAQASVAIAIERFLTGLDLAPHAFRRARQLMRADAEAQAADAAERQSLQWVWNEMEYGGEFFGDLPEGGYRSVVQGLAAGLDIRLSTAVTEVTLSPTGVSVGAADGTAYDATHVVLTVPLGVLKRGLPVISPALPPGHAGSIDRLGFGRYEKVCVGFAEPFWRQAGISHSLLFPADPDEAAVFVMDHDAFGAGPALTFHVFDSLTGHVVDAEPSDAARWAVDLFAGAVGRASPEPVAIAVTSWARDPWAAGAYSHLPPGSDPSDADRLAEPVGGRLLFAGEHTQSARIGYADGAMTSGVRAAKALLRRSRVRLGPVG